MIEPVRLTSAEAVALWGELNPGSDIDLLFLLRQKMDAALDHFI